MVIKVHGRSSLTLPLSYKDADGNAVDLNDYVLFFESLGANIRKPLIADDTNPFGKAIFLSVEEVDQLPTRAVDFIVRDETDNDRPIIFASGQLQRVGWKDEVQA